MPLDHPFIFIEIKTGGVHILDFLANCCIECVDELAILFEVICEVMIIIYSRATKVLLNS